MKSMESVKRTERLVFNIKKTFLLKIVTAAVTFALVPISFNYLGQERYGVWSTILSVLICFMTLDFGIGNGVKNKLSEALAHGDNQHARKIISTGYITFAAFFPVFASGVCLFAYTINHNKFFNTNNIGESEIRSAVIVVGLTLGVNFSLSLYKQLSHAVQESSYEAAGQFVANLMVLCLVALLYLYSHSNLLYMALAYGAAMVLSSVIVSILFFTKSRDLIPSLSGYEKSVAKDITSLGMRFFLLQIAHTLIFSIDRILITRISGPESVAVYDVVVRLFSVLFICHSTITTPFWSAFSEAYAKKDVRWVSSVVNKLTISIVPIAVVVVGLCIFGNQIITLWIGNDLEIPLTLLVLVGCVTLLRMWSNNFSLFLNGTSNIAGQFKMLLLGAILNVPCAIILGKYMELGVNGVVIATILSMSPFAVMGPVEVFAIIKRMKNSHSHES
jgi:O-antigen/teichoic acid export membrane protein